MVIVRLSGGKHLFSEDYQWEMTRDFTRTPVKHPIKNTVEILEYHLIQGYSCRELIEFILLYLLSFHYCDSCKQADEAWEDICLMGSLLLHFIILDPLSLTRFYFLNLLSFLF